MAFALARTIIRFIRPRLRTCPTQMTSQDKTGTLGTAAIDKELFEETWSVFALRLPAQLCNDTRKAMRDHVLCAPRIRTVVKESNRDNEDQVSTFVYVLLKYFAEEPTSRFSTPPLGNGSDELASLSCEQVAGKLRLVDLPRKISPSVQRFLQNLGKDDVVVQDIDIDYSHWSIDSVLRALLPLGTTIPSSFETIGHIAHLNLREEHDNHKKIIGEVMLEKLRPRITTIVNKLHSTGGPYRTFAMEVLAGEDNMETSVKENGCRFSLNFAKVYWNSRLEGEHRRMLQSLESEDVLADAFCGIGPFVVPAARQKRCKMVYANDLNPSSVYYLEKNVKSNHIDATRIQTSCSCAREFLRRLVDEKVRFTKVLMNFPSGAPEFLDVFRGLYKNWQAGEKPVMPKVHCYCFIRGDSDIDFDDARRRVRVALFGDENAELDRFPNALISVREVRDVAPRKRQVCVTFTVPEFVGFGENGVQVHRNVNALTGPPEKRQKLQ